MEAAKQEDKTSDEDGGHSLSTDAQDDITNGSDDEFLVELAQEAVAAARGTFEAQDYTGTCAYIQEALDIAKDLPEQWRNVSDSWDVSFMLAICAHHIESAAEAEARLLRVLDASSQLVKPTREQQRQTYELCHLISQLYIKVDNLEAAQIHCDKALQGRRRVLGKTNIATYESIALMARILQLRGNDSRSTIYRRLIHDERKRRELEDQFASLDRSREATEQYRLARAVGPMVNEEGRRKSYSELESTDSLIDTPSATTVSHESRSSAQAYLKSIQIPIEELNAGAVEDDCLLLEDRPAINQSRDSVRPVQALSPFDDRFSTLPEAVVRPDEIEKHLSLQSDDSEKHLSGAPDAEEKQLTQPPDEQEKELLTARSEEEEENSTQCENDKNSGPAVRQPGCTMTIQTTEGDIDMAIRKESTEISTAVFPLAAPTSSAFSGTHSKLWKQFVEEVASGAREGATIVPSKKENGRLVLKFVSSRDRTLKLSIDPTTTDFVFGADRDGVLTVEGRRGYKVFAVEGNIVAGMSLINKLLQAKREWTGMKFYEKRITVRKWEIHDDTEISGTRNVLVLDPRLNYEP